MAFGRFLVPGLALLAIASGVGVGSVARPGVALVAALACGAWNAAPAWGVHPISSELRESFRFRFNPGPRGQAQPFVDELTQWSNMGRRVDEWAVTGRDLARLTPPDASSSAPAAS